MKKCSRCKLEQKDSNFYTIKDRWKTRLTSYCKNCNREYYRDYQRLFSHEFKEHHNTNTRVYKAVKRGQIEKESCFVCGDPKVEGHHWNYSLPLEVFWLCKKHHEWIHSNDI